MFHPFPPSYPLDESYQNRKLTNKSVILTKREKTVRNVISKVRTIVLES